MKEGNKRVALTFSTEEEALLKEAAGDLPLATWGRAELLKAARRILKEKQE
jgi:hypothetical protein